MSFSQLSRDVQLELLAFVSPPDWPEYLAQFVAIAEKEFELPQNPTRLDVWGSCNLRDAESWGPRDTVNANWSVHPTIVVERATWGEGLEYKLGVYSEETEDGDGDAQRDDWTIGCTIEKTWVDKELFLKEASDLLAFCPRQITQLPKLACSVGLVRLDKYIDIVNLHGGAYWYLHNFTDPAGATSLLHRLQNGNQ